MNEANQLIASSVIILCCGGGRSNSDYAMLWLK
jgi:hypothetical protein